MGEKWGKNPYFSNSWDLRPTPRRQKALLFVGKIDYQLDDRKRVPIPPAFRGPFDAGGYQSTGNAACVVLHTSESLAKTAAIIEAIPAETQEGDDARRDFYGNVWPAQKDAQGRVTLRDELIAHAGLTRDVIVIGMGDRLEVWDRSTYYAREPEQRENRIRATARRTQSPPGEG